MTSLAADRQPIPAELRRTRGDGSHRALDETDRPSKGKEGDKGIADRKAKGGDDKPKKPRSKLPFVILGIVVLLMAIGGALYYFLTIDLVSTDDAYTDGNAISMAAKVSGYATVLMVNDNTPVKAGDLLLQIDQRDYITSRDQSRANLDLAQAQLRSAQIELEQTRVRAPANLLQAKAQLDQARANQGEAQLNFRRQKSVDPRATTQQNVDQATANFHSNIAQVGSAQAQVQIASLVPQNIADSEATVKQRQAQVEQAEANLAQAELNLSYTEVRAPQDGKITMRNVNVGTFVQAGQQLFYIATLDTWVTANFKEGQLARMRPGQSVSMTVDAYPKIKLHGHVDSIQQGSGSRFSAFPAQNATGNFVKIVQRVPVKLTIDSGYDRQQGLPLGLSVVPTVNVQ